MLDPFYSFLDSEPDVSSELKTGARGGGEAVGEEFIGDIDVNGTLFATLLTDVANSNTTDTCSEIMSSISDSESDDMFEYLSKTQEKLMEKETDTVAITHEPVRKTRSHTNQISSSGKKVAEDGPTSYSRPPLMCATNVNMKSPRVEIQKLDMAASDSKSEKCMNRGAIMARENREKKKQYMKHLESDLEEVKLENFDLKTKYNLKSKLCESLQKEVKYLRNVLANQSCISTLLKNIHATQGAAFTSSLTTSVNSEDKNSQKRTLDENDNYEKTSNGVYVRATGSHKKIKNDSVESKADGYSSPLTPCPSPDQVDGAGAKIDVDKPVTKKKSVTQRTSSNVQKEWCSMTK